MITVLITISRNEANPNVEKVVPDSQYDLPLGTRKFGSQISQLLSGLIKDVTGDKLDSSIFLKTN